MTKLNIAWVSYACCEDSTIMFAEVLNDYFFEFKSRFNFIDAPVIAGKRDTNTPLDIAFLEGACISPENAQSMKQYRDRAKIIVAIGSCACTGMPSAHRNTFDQDQLKEIEFLIQRFDYAQKVEPIENIIKVDAKVPGCPMDVSVFLSTVNQLLTQTGLPPIPLVENQ